MKQKDKKYLFFDIESIDKGNKYTCTFGYVLVDSKFTIIETDDIIINPCVNMYDNYVLKNLFSYTKDRAVASPTFEYYFDRINKLISSPDIVILGCSLLNDFRYLTNDYERLGKDASFLKGYDVQLFHKLQYKLPNPLNLFKIAESLDVNLTSFTEHNSQFDAIASMMVAQKLCSNLKLTLDQMIKKFDILIVPKIKKQTNANSTNNFPDLVERKM